MLFAVGEGGGEGQSRQAGQHCEAWLVDAVLVAHSSAHAAAISLDVRRPREGGRRKRQKKKGIKKIRKGRKQVNKTNEKREEVKKGQKQKAETRRENGC